MAEQPRERTFVVDSAFLRREANSAVRTFFAPLTAVVRAVAANSQPEDLRGSQAKRRRRASDR